MLSIFITLCGLYSLATGKAPMPMFGRKDTRAEGAPMRMVGAVLVLAFPLALALRLLLPMSFGETALMFAPAVEIGVAVATLVAGFVVSRRAHGARA